jgi:hypothetical protein
MKVEWRGEPSNSNRGMKLDFKCEVKSQATSVLIDACSSVAFSGTSLS